LPPAAVYLLIGLATLVENVFPPTPSDVIVALGGFLSHRAHIRPELVFLVAWLSNLAGTVGLYVVGRRWGRQFFASRTGRRLVTPEAIIAMEREYLRFGLAGIVLARLIPGFRSFVAPFTGLVNLSPARALLPLALASAAWYGGLTWAGAKLGDEWDRIVSLISGLNRTLAIVAVVTVVALVLYYARRPVARPRYQRLLGLVHRALGDAPEAGPEVPEDAATAGAAALMYELARADLMITAEERPIIEAHFKRSWQVAHDDPDVGMDGDAIPLDQTREVAAAIANRFDRQRRLALVERLWRIALSDGTLSRHEGRLMQRAGELLGLSAADLAEVRRQSGP
jgi:membrane protein DedA with SNARE-associated domain/uncharacterized tellurite resistance protein B-like protein